MNGRNAKPELILLVHGFGATRWLMWPLSRRLRRGGYATRLWTYFTLHGSLCRIGIKLADELNCLAESDQYSRIHVVAHSMGGLAMRCALRHHLPAQLGRIVMIGTPNHGSHAATRLSRRFGRFSPTLVEMCDTPDSFANSLPPAPQGSEIGVIAASGDTVVTLECTHLEGQRDHCTVPGMHSAALWSPACAAQVENFLKNGEFEAVDEFPAVTAGAEGVLTE